MCGIVGILSTGDNLVSNKALCAATNALRHRGPDGHQTWLSLDRRIGLGHTRLNIVSPDGVQPIVNEDGQCRIVVNGEFYGHKAIRRKLEAGGHRFRTDTDSEIALHLYEEHEMESLEQLRGEFAFILWDGSRQTFYAVRDRFGIRSLFYARVGGLVYVASEAKALLTAGISAEWDEGAVLAHMFGCLYPDRSLFKYVHQVPPGHYLKVTCDRVSLVRYWDLNYPRMRKSGPNRASDPKIYLPQIRQLLSESVQLRTQAYVRVGCMLSGGVDSSTVLALASEHSSRPVDAFTIAFRTSEFNEVTKARTAATHIGANLFEISVNDADMADTFAEAAYHAEMVQFNAHGTARYILTREIQKAGYRSVMAGEGADELFLGYGFVKNAVQSAGQSVSLLRILSRVLRLLAPLNDAESRIATVSPWLARANRMIIASPQLVDAISRAIALLNGVLAYDAATMVRQSDPYKSLLTAFPWRDQLWRRQMSHQILYVWLRSIFITYHLAADRLDMGHAVEVRYPFLDHVLFENLRDIPVQAMGYENTQKYLLRHAASIWLPEENWQAPKQPFYAPPMTRNSRNSLLTLAQDTLRGPALQALPFFNQKAVLGLLDGMNKLPRLEQLMLDPLLLMMTSLCFIQQAYKL